MNGLKSTIIMPRFLGGTHACGTIADGPIADTQQYGTG